MILSVYQPPIIIIITNHLVSRLLADDDGAVQTGRSRRTRVQFAVMTQILGFAFHYLQVLATGCPGLRVPNVLVYK